MRKLVVVGMLIRIALAGDAQVVSVMDINNIDNSLSNIELSEFRSGIEIGISNNKEYFSLIDHSYDEDIIDILVKSAGPLTADDLFKVGNTLTEDFVVVIEVWKKKKNIFSAGTFGAKLKWIDIRTNELIIFKEYSPNVSQLSDLLISKLVYTLYKGTLQIETNKENYLLTVDNNDIFIRSKKRTLVLDRGLHTIEMDLRDHRSIKDTVFIDANRIHPFPKTFIRSGSEMRINGSPATALVRVSNDEFNTKGYLPEFKQQLPEGIYKVNIESPGYFPHSFSITIRDLNPIVLRKDLKPIPIKTLVGRSLIYPGLGHIYAGNKFCGYSYILVESALLVAGGYFSYRLFQDTAERDDLYNQYSSEYNSLTKNKIVTIEDRMTVYQALSVVTLSAALSVYLYDIYDVIKMNKSNTSQTTSRKETRTRQVRNRSEDAFNELDQETNDD